MNTKINKWGNSLAVRIPSILVQDARLCDGLEMLIERKNNKIILTPKRPLNYRLDSLLSEVTSDNLHNEIDSGESLGSEEW